MSEQLKNNAGERKLRVTLLSAEWKTSSNGDLTTINRELAIQMAKHPNVEVSVFLPRCSEEDKKDADSYNVKLIEAVKLGGFEPVDWLASVPQGHAMDCVLGHGVALGRQIQIIKRNSNYSHCKWLQVVHTAPEEIGMYKNISEGQQKQQTEIELCVMADQVVTIGPKLTEAYKNQLRKQDVFNLTPSIFAEFSDVQQASDTRRTFCILVIESGDSEDFDVKGYNIAAKAIADPKDKSYQLKFASKQKGKEDELAGRLLQCGIGRNQLSISSLDGNRETLANLFSVVDIAILPSKTEGFGLSALQAISAGLPVLVSGNSGIAEALKEVSNGSQCIVDSEDPADWAKAIKAVRDRKRNVRLAEAKILRENYLQQFSWEKHCDFLVEKMYNLAFGNKQTWNSEHENGGACSSSGLGARLIDQRSEKSDVHQCKETEQEPSAKEIELQGDFIRNRKRTAPSPSNVNIVVKKKREASEEASDPVSGPAGVQHGDSALSILENMTSCVVLAGVDNNTQSMLLSATETSDMKGGVPVGTRGWNPLHCAAAGGNEAIIETLLSSGLDIDSRDNDGTTPSMVAAAKGQEKTVNLLLSKGADPHIKNFIGLNLLHAAAEGGNTSIVRSMLSFDIDINSKDDESSTTPLMIAVMENHVEVVKYLLQKGADISLTVGSEKRNALHTASEHGSIAAIELLLSRGLSVNSRDGQGNTPLMCAAAFGQIESVNCLLKHGADPSLKGKGGWSLLHCAAQSGNVIIIETMLSKGLDIDSRGETLGLTPLMVSIIFEKLEAAKYLLEKGADESLKTTERKISLLSLASAGGSVAAIEMLLSHGCSIVSRDNERNTPLMHAARLGNTEVLKYLLAQGADPLLQNKFGQGLLHFAALSNNAVTIEAVLSQNFDINARCTDLGVTPLLFCLINGKLEAANYLLAMGADENLKSKDGLTVLSAAAIGGDVAAIEMLLERGHNPNSRDGCDETPLMWAVRAGNKAAVEYLLPLTHESVVKGHRGPHF